jgi:hypothetical protein
MREATKILAFSLSSLAALLIYIRMAAPETPAITYGWIIAGFMWGNATLCLYILIATRRYTSRRVTLDQVADQVVVIEAPNEHTLLH